MPTAKRFRNRWTINECIQLEREFELLQLSIDEIAKRHQRTPCAIISRLAYEGLADYNVLYNDYYKLNVEIPIINQAAQDEEEQDEEEQDDDNSSDYEDEDETLKAQVMRLEKQVTMLMDMIMKNNKGKSVFSLFG